jgi:hypothetical protein
VPTFYIVYQLATDKNFVERILEKATSSKEQSDAKGENVHSALMQEAIADRLTMRGQSTSRNQAPVRYLEYVRIDHSSYRTGLTHC